MAVMKYAQDAGVLGRCLAADKAKQPNRPKGWLPSIGQLLAWMVNEETGLLPAEAHKSIQKFLTDTKKSLTLDALNWFTHLRYIPPTPDELKAYWVNLTPLLELVLKVQPKDET